MLARSVARFTSALFTPLTPRSADSTLATHDAQVIPVMARSRRSRMETPSPGGWVVVVTLQVYGRPHHVGPLEHRAAAGASSGPFGAAGATGAAQEHPCGVRMGRTPALLLEGGVEAPACPEVLATAPTAGQGPQNGDADHQQPEPDDVHQRSGALARSERAIARSSSISLRPGSTSCAYGRRRSASCFATRARWSGASCASRATNSRTRRCASPGSPRTSTRAPAPRGVTVRSEK